MAKKGWFILPDRAGDRTLDQQLIGLDQLFAEVQGKTVLDAGCAEGLITMELQRRGASAGHGLEILPGHIAMAQGIAEESRSPCTFEVANLNEFDLSRLGQFDIVIMLAILHKLKDPSRVCAELVSHARDLVVIRLPPYGLTIIDARSANVPHDIGAVMVTAGFRLEASVKGPFSEWMGYFRRTNQATQNDVTDFADTRPMAWPDEQVQQVDPLETVDLGASDAPATRRRRGKRADGG